MFGFGKIRGREHTKEDLRCSFCNKDQADVSKLVAGPSVFICGECIQMCVDIINDDARARTGRDEAPERQEPCARYGRTSEPQAGAGPSVEVLAWHVRCPLCEITVPAEGAIPIAGRGALCRPCVVTIQATALPTTES